MKFFTKEVKIALTAILGIVVLFYGLQFLKGLTIFSNDDSYYVTFTDVSGLSSSSPVYANGYKVGVVKDIIYDYSPQGKIVAVMGLDKNMRVPQGTRAEIASDLLGNIKVNLVLGSDPLHMLASGDTISGGAEEGMMSKLGAMMPAIEAIVPKLDSIMTSLNILLADPAFTDALLDRWSVFNDLVTKIVEEGGILDQYYRQTLISQRYECEKYGYYTGDDNQEEIKNDHPYIDEIEQLRKWVSGRQDWVNENLESLKSLTCTVTFVSDDKVLDKVIVKENMYIIVPPEVLEKVFDSPIDTIVPFHQLNAVGIDSTGRFYMSEPLFLRPEDSGTKESPLVIRGIGEKHTSVICGDARQRHTQVWPLKEQCDSLPIKKHDDGLPMKGMERMIDFNTTDRTITISSVRVMSR